MKIKDEKTGLMLDTARAKKSWAAIDDWRDSDKPEWINETLYLSEDGRYYLVSIANHYFAKPSIRIITKREATKWLKKHEDELLTQSVFVAK